MKFIKNEELLDDLEPLLDLITEFVDVKSQLELQIVKAVASNLEDCSATFPECLSEFDIDLEVDLEVNGVEEYFFPVSF